MQIVSSGVNLHEMPNPVFWENKESVINLSSAAFAYSVLSVKLDSGSNFTILIQSAFFHLICLWIKFVYSNLSRITSS